MLFKQVVNNDMVAVITVYIHVKVKKIVTNRTSVITLLTTNPREAGRTTTNCGNPKLNACPIVFTTHVTTGSFECKKLVLKELFCF